MSSNEADKEQVGKSMDDTAITQREAEIKAMLRRTLRQVASLLRHHTVVLFGSRAAGSARPRADFDVGVYGAEPLPLRAFFDIEDMFDALPTLYKIDWVDLNRVNEEFRRRAMGHTEVAKDRQGITFERAECFE
jgi:predicted nucleotidyltransferase